MCLEFLDALKWVLFLFVCVERVTEKALHTWHSRVSPQPPPLAPPRHSFPFGSANSLFPPRALEESENPVVYVHFISRAAIVWGGGPGLLSQQRTTHHFLLSSLLLGLITESKHSGSVILLVSQGRWFIQFPPPQHRTVARSFSKRKVRNRSRCRGRVCVKPASVLRVVSRIEDVRQNVRNVFPPVSTLREESHIWRFLRDSYTLRLSSLFQATLWHCQVDSPAWYKYLHLNGGEKCSQTTSMKKATVFFSYIQSEASETFRG